MRDILIVEFIVLKIIIQKYFHSNSNMININRYNQGEKVFWVLINLKP